MTLDDPISVHDVVNVFIAAEISWGRSEAERHILSLQAQVVLKEEIIYKLWRIRLKNQSTHLNFALVRDQIVLVDILDRQDCPIGMSFHVAADFVILVVMDLASAFEPFDWLRRGESLVATMNLSFWAFLGVEVNANRGVRQSHDVSKEERMIWKKWRFKAGIFSNLSMRIFSMIDDMS